MIIKYNRSLWNQVPNVLVTNSFNIFPRFNESLLDLVSVDFTQVTRLTVAFLILNLKLPGRDHSELDQYVIKCIT